METIRVLLVPVDEAEPSEVIIAEGTWEGLRGALGSHAIQQVQLNMNTLLWVDENGIALGLAVNPRANAVINSYYPGYTRERGPVRGPILLVGEDENEDHADIPDEALIHFARLTGETQVQPYA